MGRRRTQRACATIPSMLSSARGAPELRPQAAADAEVSAASAAATESEAARPGDRGRRNRGGRVAEATTSLKGVAEGAECRGDSPTRKPDPEPGRMDHHQAGTGRYQVLHNEEDNSESSAVEQPSTSNPTPHTVQAAPSASGHETESSPPPYSSITVEVPTTSDTEVYSEFYPVPPPYSVATSLPTYDEAEKAKAAALAAAAAETSQRIQEEECPPRDDFNDPDQLRVGNDGIFMLAFFKWKYQKYVGGCAGSYIFLFGFTKLYSVAFIFNWLGFCLSFCITNTIAGRYGAICGFGLSLIKWILIVRFSDYFTGYFNGQYWLWWIFLVLDCIDQTFLSYINVKFPDHL
uniref:Nedd4 family interacting protein 2 n=1 Tax=Bos mutus grunniens TaxID=30521 RepID=A0A8B9Y2Q5_BOSMU